MYTNNFEDIVDVEDLDNGVVQEGEWCKNTGQDGLYNLKPQIERVSVDAKLLREQLAAYFVNEGAVEWQWHFI